MSTKKLVIRPYKLGSAAARALAKSLTNKLGYRVWMLKATTVPRRNNRVINWGNGTDYWDAGDDFNSKTAKATNKLSAFKAFKEHGVPHPNWTTSKEEAQKWINDGKFVVARKILNGNSGQGIVLCHKDTQPLVNAPLYTLYKPKRNEYRVHVVAGKVVEIVQKKRKAGTKADDKIRNHGRGWVFCRDGIFIPDGIGDVAINAVSSCGLQFGAVDIIWNEKENQCYVLEVNTAPGIEGTTVAQYTKAFVEAI